MYVYVNQNKITLDVASIFLAKRLVSYQTLKIFSRSLPPSSLSAGTFFSSAPTFFLCTEKQRMGRRY